MDLHSGMREIIQSIHSRLPSAQTVIRAKELIYGNVVVPATATNASATERIYRQGNRPRFADEKLEIPVLFSDWPEANYYQLAREP